MSAQPRSSDAGLGSGGGGSGQAGTMSQQNLNQIVSVRFLSASLEPVASWRMERLAHFRICFCLCCMYVGFSHAVCIRHQTYQSAPPWEGLVL